MGDAIYVPPRGPRIRVFIDQVGDFCAVLVRPDGQTVATLPPGHYTATLEPVGPAENPNGH